MPVFTATRAGTIFAATTAVAHLYAAAGEFAELLELGWAGEATTSTKMRTRLTRASVAGTSPTTTLDIQQNDMQGLGAGATPLLQAVTTVTSPTLVAGSLLPIQSWNAHGGIVRWLAGPSERMTLIHTAACHLTMQNEVGAADGSAGFVWME